MMKSSSSMRESSTSEPDIPCVCCSVLQCVQCVAVWCSVVQCSAVCCSVLQCVAVCCSVMQCVAVCCSVLQCVAGILVSVCVFFYSRDFSCIYRGGPQLSCAVCVAVCVLQCVCCSVCVAVCELQCVCCMCWGLL